ncbi:MAG: Protease HtpX [Candidatus Anoxychlamydiales bacterium]|nr:Protease HtpX [Candidatus Anoxychlamydiales bacterium]
MSTLTKTQLKISFAYQGLHEWPKDVRIFLDEKINELANKLKINHEIEIHPGKKTFITQDWMKKKAYLIIDVKKFENCSKEINEFVLAHELAHIKHNDSFLKRLFININLIVKVALAVLFSNSFSLGFLALSGIILIIYDIPFSLTIAFTPITLVHSLISLVAYSIFSKFQEERADKTALSVCSDKAKAQAWIFFKNEQKTFLDVRCKLNRSSIIYHKILSHILIDENGNVRFPFNFTHPKLQTRINYCRLQG